MFPGTIVFISVIILALSLLTLAVQLRNGWRQNAVDRSRRLECYFRDLKMIDQKEQDGRLDEKEAEQARADLLDSVSRSMAMGSPLVAHMRSCRPALLVSFIAGLTLLVSPIIGSSYSTNSNSGAASADPVSTAMDLRASSPDGNKRTARRRVVVPEVAKLEGYVKTLSSGAESFDFTKMFAPVADRPTNRSFMSTPPSLPDVDTMIARLAKRLEASPGDVEGWRMLGWSYFNTQKYEKAVAAYEKAVRLDPKSARLKAALKEARSKLAVNQIKKQQKQAGAEQSAQSRASNADDDAGVKTGPGPTREDIANANKMNVQDRQAMIEGMVARLARRLNASPDDPSGWQRLIHSRMVLGDEKAARKALDKALDVFSSDPETRASILASAEKSGLTIKKKY